MGAVALFNSYIVLGRPASYRVLILTDVFAVVQSQSTRSLCQVVVFAVLWCLTFGKKSGWVLTHPTALTRFPSTVQGAAARKQTDYVRSAREIYMGVGQN